MAGRLVVKTTYLQGNRLHDQHLGSIYVQVKQKQRLGSCVAYASNGTFTRSLESLHSTKSNESLDFVTVYELSLMTV